jgi:speckle-type POZ protein
MLRFVYTGKVPSFQSSGTACELLAAAEKYKIDELKEICEHQLIKILTIENALDHFLLADKHRAATLRKAAKEILVENIKKVLANHDWDQKLRDQPVLMAEIIMESWDITNT